MEKLSEIIKHKAILSHVCEGKVYFIIDTGASRYQLEIDSMDRDWKAVYIEKEYKAVTLMRWIRAGIEKGDDTFLKVK